MMWRCYREALDGDTGRLGMCWAQYLSRDILYFSKRYWRNKYVVLLSQTFITLSNQLSCYAYTVCTHTLSLCMCVCSRVRPLCYNG